MSDTARAGSVDGPVLHDLCARSPVFNAAWIVLAALLVGYATIETLFHVAFSLAPLDPDKESLYRWLLVLSQPCAGVWPFIAKRRIGVAHVITWAGLGFVCFASGRSTLWRLRTDYPLSGDELWQLTVSLSLLAASGVLAVLSLRKQHTLI
jgi:hypothetical protein